MIDNTLDPVWKTGNEFTVFVPDGNSGRPPKGEVTLECYDSDMPFSGFGLGKVLNTSGDFLGCFKATGFALSGGVRPIPADVLDLDDGLDDNELYIPSLNTGSPATYDLQPREGGVVVGLEATEGMHTDVVVTVVSARGLAKVRRREEDTCGCDCGCDCDCDCDCDCVVLETH